ncbi:MAG: rod shape-determining protein MreD [Limibacillus sp.]
MSWSAEVKAPFLQRFDLALRAAAPITLSLLILLLSQVPVGLPGGLAFTPFLPLICVFYWTVHRPDLMPGWAVFVLGVLHDLLSGGPFGVGAFTLLAAYGLVASQRRLLVSFGVGLLWLAFAVLALLAALLVWLLSMMIMGVFLNPAPLAYQYVLTVAVYPLLAWFFARTQKSVLR